MIRYFNNKAPGGENGFPFENVRIDLSSRCHAAREIRAVVQLRQFMVGEPLTKKDPPYLIVTDNGTVMKFDADTTADEIISIYDKTMKAHASAPAPRPGVLKLVR